MAYLKDPMAVVSLTDQTHTFPNTLQHALLPHSCLVLYPLRQCTQIKVVVVVVVLLKKKSATKNYYLH